MQNNIEFQENHLHEVISVEVPAILTRVLDLLNEHFPLLRSVPLTADTSLLGSGLLDSFAVVTLVALLEQAFHIDINVEGIELESFETPRAIAALCQEPAGGG